MDVARLNKIVDQRGGLFTRADAKACGFSPYQIRRRVEVGDWCRVLGPVFVHSGRPISAGLRDRAAQLAVPGSVLAGPSAARLLRMEVRDPGAYVLVPPDRRTEPPPGIRLLVGRVEPADVATADGIPVTWRPRTVFDCLRVLGAQAGADLLDRALQRRWVSLDSLASYVRADLGRWGIPRVVSHLRQVAAGTHSAAERLLVTLLRAAGIRGWRANAVIDGPDGLPIAKGDVVFRKQRLVLEVDGWAYHTDVAQFQRDRDRQNDLVLAGWTVLRFTWRDLTERPERVIVLMRGALASPYPR
jgi:very-short-patch-repair endonuclease